MAKRLIPTYRYGKVWVDVESIYRGSVYAVLAPAVWIKGKGIFGIREGEILVSYMERYLLFRSLDSARHGLRESQRDRGDESSGERAEMLAAGQAITELIRTTSKAAHADRPQQTFDRGIGALVARFEGSRAENKTAALDHLESAEEEEDALGRPNLGRRRMYAAYARREIEERVKVLARISGAIAPWLAAVCAAHGVYLETLKKVREKLPPLHDRISTAPERPLDEGDVVRLSAAIDELIGMLEILGVEPFLSHRDLTVGDLMKARGALRCGEHLAAARSLGRALSGSKFALARARLANIREDILVNLPARKSSPGQAQLACFHKAELDRLQKFIGFLGELDDEDLSIRNHGQALELSRRALALLTGASATEAAEAMAQAIRLL